jgi:hypothetical protein
MVQSQTNKTKGLPNQPSYIMKSHQITYRSPKRHVGTLDQALVQEEFMIDIHVENSEYLKVKQPWLRRIGSSTTLSSLQFG